MVLDDVDGFGERRFDGGDEVMVGHAEEVGAGAAPVACTLCVG
jgi:hypothetical protein